MYDGLICNTRSIKIKEKCEDKNKDPDNRFCSNLDIYKFEKQNNLTREGVLRILKELIKEEKVLLGRLINGYYLKIK